MLSKAGMSRLLYQRYWLHVVGMGLLASVALYLYGVPDGPDVSQHFRLAQGFFESIRGGDFYPSWLSSTNGGYGDPSVRFYPPALYYSLSFFRLITGDWYIASVLTLSLLTVIGGVGMYLWASALTKQSYAVFAALLYMLSPFHANEMYQAGLYAQFACASVLPFVFAFTTRTIASGRWRDAGGLGLSYALLVLSNLPLALLGSVAVGIYAVIRLAQSFSRRSLCQLVAGLLSGLALGCGYWLPMLLERKWKRPSGSGQEQWFDYKSNFIFHRSPNNIGDYWLPILVATTLLMAVPAVVLLVRRNRQALAPALVALLTFLMATFLSKPIWDAFPALQETQFPWRWLTITSACLSILVTLSLPELVQMSRTRLRPLSFALLGTTAIALSFTIFQIIRTASFQNRSTFDEKVASLQASETNKYLLPVWVSENRLRTNQAVEVAGRDAQVQEWSATRREFKVEAGAATAARLRIFYYPYWQAVAEGKQLTTRPASDGALLVSLPPTATTVTVNFVEPTTTRVAGVVSFLGMLCIGLLLANPFMPARHA